MPADTASYWKLIASADVLSEDLLGRIWASGVQAARVSIAARADLTDQLHEEILTSHDVSLLRAWTSYPARSRELVNRAVQVCGHDELTASNLARQQNLGSPAALRLLELGSGAVASVMLQRDPPLTRQVQLVAATKLGQSRVFTGWHSVSYLTGVLPAEPVLWEAIIEASPEGSTAVPLAAIESSDGDVRLCRAALHWWARRSQGLTEDSRQDAMKTCDALLRCYQLTPADFRQVAGITRDHRQAVRAEGIADLDPCDAVNQVLLGNTSPEVFSRLVGAALELVNLPFTDIMLAGLRAPNREQIARELEQLRSRLLGKGSRQVLATLWMEGDHGLAVEFVESGGTLLWDSDEWGPCPEGLIAALASAGSRALLRSPLCDSHADLVADHYVPLPAALEVPQVAARALSQIEQHTSNDPAALETALVLLGQWQGGLFELIRTATALAATPPCPSSSSIPIS